MNTPKLEVHEELAYLLISLGWASPNDAQWTNLRDALPKIRDLLTNGNELRKASTDALSVIEVAAKITNSPMIDEVTARLKSALENGFILKSKADGKEATDLHPYVYSFARELIAAAPTPPAQEVEPVAWVDVADSYEGPYDFHGIKLLPIGKHNLYTHPQSDELRKGK